MAGISTRVSPEASRRIAPVMACSGLATARTMIHAIATPEDERQETTDRHDGFRSGPCRGFRASVQPSDHAALTGRSRQSREGIARTLRLNWVNASEPTIATACCRLAGSKASSTVVLISVLTWRSTSPPVAVQQWQDVGIVFGENRFHRSDVLVEILDRLGDLYSIDFFVSIDEAVQSDIGKGELARDPIDQVDGIVGCRVQPLDLGDPLGLHEDEGGAKSDDRKDDAETNGQLPGEREISELQFRHPR